MGDEFTGVSLRERRRSRTREEIVLAALEVIASAGIDEATIERIQNAAGVSRGTLYAYFPGGRHELLRAAYARLGHDLVARTSEAELAAADWAEGIQAHARTMFQLAEEPHLGDFFNLTGPALIPSGSERGIGSRASAAMIAERIATAQHDGLVDTVIDAEAVALLLVGAIREAAVVVAAGKLERSRAEAGFARILAGFAASS